MKARNVNLQVKEDKKKAIMDVRRNHEQNDINNTEKQRTPEYSLETKNYESCAARV